MVEKLIRVRATRNGHFKHYRTAGDEFTIPENLFSKAWMEELNPPRKPQGKAEADKGGDDGADET